jgi:hypothetical protein
MGNDKIVKTTMQRFLEHGTLFDSERICCVNGCTNRQLIAVAGDDLNTIFMCLPHTRDWSNSQMCKDAAQLNNNHFLRSLSFWLEIKSEEASNASEVNQPSPTYFS